MINALLIVSMLGMGTVETTMPSMEECLDARLEILKQDIEAKVICIPMTAQQSKSQEMKEMFSVFMDMVITLKESEIYYEDEWSGEEYYDGESPSQMTDTSPYLLMVVVVLDLLINGVQQMNGNLLKILK